MSMTRRRAQQSQNEGAAEGTSLEEGREEERRRVQAAAARRRAAHYATFTEDDDTSEAGLHIDLDGENAENLGPRGIARSLHQARGAALNARMLRLREDPKAQEVKDFGIKWNPRGPNEKFKRRARGIKSLKDTTLDVLAQYAEHISSLWGVPDYLKVELAARVCASGGLVPEVAHLFVLGEPQQVELPNCTKLDEDSMKSICKEAMSSSLVKLHLGHCGRGMGDRAAVVLGTTCPLVNLQELSLNHAYRLLDSGLECILKATRNLKYLSLQSCSRLSGNFLKGLARQSPALAYLDLSECRGISKDILSKFLPQLKALSTLKLDGNQEVGDKCVKAISLSCPITALSLKQCCEVSDEGLTSLCEQCPDLTVLCLDDLKNIGEEGINSLAANCPNLQELSLRHCTKIPEKSLCAVAANGKLKHLNMSYLHRIHGPLLVAISEFCETSLETLDISFCRKIPEDAIGLVADSCVNLRKLNIFGLSHITRRFLNGHRNEIVEVVGVGTLQW